MDKDEYFKKLSDVTQPESFQQQPVAPSAPSEDSIKTIHTLKSDIADAIKKDGLSYAKIATAEAEREKRMRGLVVAPQKKVKNFFVITLSVVFLIVGIGGVSAALFYFKKPQINTPLLTNKENPFSSGYTQTISLRQVDKQTIIAAVNVERQKQFDKGQLKYVSFNYTYGTTTTPLSANLLFNVFGVNLGGPTLRSFQDDYKFGFYSGNQLNSSFLILHTDSYDDAYGGMIEWEKYMSQDLSGFLIIPQKITSTTTAPLVAVSDSSSTLIKSAATTSSLIGTTTSKAATSSVGISTSSATSTVLITVKTIPINVQFQDEVVGNKDVRVLRDSEGNTIFLYAFLDQQTLVMATNEDVLQEIENKIISAQRVQ